MGHLFFAGVVKEMTTSIERSVWKETSIMSLPIGRLTASSDHVGTPERRVDG